MKASRVFWHTFAFVLLLFGPRMSLVPSAYSQEGGTPGETPVDCHEPQAVRTPESCVAVENGVVDNNCRKQEPDNQPGLVTGEVRTTELISLKSNGMIVVASAAARSAGKSEGLGHSGFIESSFIRKDGADPGMCEHTADVKFLKARADVRVRLVGPVTIGPVQRAEGESEVRVGRFSDLENAIDKTAKVELIARRGLRIVPIPGGPRFQFTQLTVTIDGGAPVVSNPPLVRDDRTEVTSKAILHSESAFGPEGEMKFNEFAVYEFEGTVLPFIAQAGNEFFQQPGAPPPAGNPRVFQRALVDCQATALEDPKMEDLDEPGKKTPPGTP